MNKYFQIFGLATALSVTSITSAQAQMSNNHFMHATQEELTVPDYRNHIVVSPNASRVVACTADKHLVLTYVFASAHYKTVGGSNKPLPVTEYLDGLVAAYKDGAKGVYSKDFNASARIRGVAPGIRRAITDYSVNFNRAHGTTFDWMYKAYYLTPKPSPLCK